MTKHSKSGEESKEIGRTSKIAVCYARQSTAKQEKSVGQQIEWALETAKEMGLTLSVPKDYVDLARPHTGTPNRLGAAYFDSAISGATSVDDRPGLKAMLAYAMSNEDVGYILVWDRARLGRWERNEVGVGIEKDLREAGITIVTKSEVLRPRLISDGSQVSDVVAYLEFQQAGSYRVGLAESVLRGQSDVAKDGFWCGGSAPYGFVRMVFDEKTQRVGHEIAKNLSMRKGRDKGKAVVVLPGTSEEDLRRHDIVRFIHTEYNLGVRGLSAIARVLNRQGHPSPFAGLTRHYRDGRVQVVPGTWTVNSVRGILEQPLYMGKLSWGRRLYGSVRRFDKHKAGGFRQVRNDERSTKNRRHALAHEYRDPEDWLLVEPRVPFPPIIPPALWEANMERLKHRGQRGHQRGTPKCADGNRFPLNVVCGDCGARMSGHYQGKMLVFKCSTYLNSGGAKCFANWVPRDAVVLFVLETVRRQIRYLRRENQLEAEVRRIMEETKSNRHDLEVQLDAMRARLDRLKMEFGQAYRDSIAPGNAEQKAIICEIRDKLGKEMETAKAELRRLEMDLVNIGLGSRDDIAIALGFLERFERVMEHLPDDGLRRVFDALKAKMTVQFAPNLVGKGRRRLRTPTGGTLAFDPASNLLESVVETLRVPGNEEPSAGAEGPSSNDKHWVG